MRRAAIRRLLTCGPQQLDFFGLSNEQHTLAWLEADPLPLGLAFSLLLLDTIEPVAAPDPGLWQALRGGDPALGLPEALLRGATSDAPLARWLDRLAGIARSEPPAAELQLGRWAPARRLLRLAPFLKAADAASPRGQLRALLGALNDGDWVVSTTIW